MKQAFLYLVIIAIASGCVPTRESPKYMFSDGVYNIRGGMQKKRAYLSIEEQQIRVSERNSTGAYHSTPDTVISLVDTVASAGKVYHFYKYSFDIDFISIPLKFRPALADFPAQLNATVNGGLFIGRRADVYRLSRKKNEIGKVAGTLQHYGFSAGAFTGIGSAVMNPSVTRNAISTEYDAVVIPIGFTVLMGYNNLTFGVAGGLDHMLSHHRKYWMYRGKPWIGLTVGLNLN